MLWSRCIAVAISVFLVAGCASYDTIKQERGQGIKRTFKQPYDEVFKAVMDAVTQRKLEVVSTARDSGTILLSSGASLDSLGGERIAIFLTRLSDHATSVEVLAHPRVSTVSFPPDWPDLLFGDIEENLADQRLSK